MANEENTQPGNVEIEIKCGKLAKVKAQVQNNAIRNITAVSYQNTNTQPNAQTIGFIKPDMVIDFHMGNNTSLVSDNDPRFLIEDNPDYRKRWSLGYGGWITLGFSKGFEAIRENVIRFVELAVGEWVDIWVAKDINNNRPVNYQNTNIYGCFKDENGNAYFSKGDLNKYQAIDASIINPANDRRPAWLTDKWFYVGAVKGSGTSTVNGPHLGIVGEYFPGNYHYLLVHDVCSHEATSPWGGADIGEIGVYLTHATLEMYFLLVIDDSASPTQNKLDEYRIAVENQIQIWQSIQGQDQTIVKYLGVRMVRWKNGEPPEGWCENRMVITGDFSNANELTDRLEFDYSKNGNLFESQRWVPFDLVDEEFNKVIDNIKTEIKLDKQYTPFVEALDDVVKYDFKDKDGNNISTDNDGKLIYSFSIKIISDGIPDPCDNFGLDDINDADSEKAGIIKAYVGTAVSDTVPVSYSVRNELISIKSHIKNQSIEFIGDFPEVNGSPVSWIIDEYEKLTDENGEKLIHITLLENVIEGTGEGIHEIDHTVIYHTDCLNGDQNASRRIGADEKKRVIILSNNSRCPLPLAWSGGAEISYEDGNECFSPNFE